MDAPVLCVTDNYMRHFVTQIEANRRKQTRVSAHRTLLIVCGRIYTEYTNRQTGADASDATVWSLISLNATTQGDATGHRRPRQDEWTQVDAGGRGWTQHSDVGRVD